MKSTAWAKPADMPMAAPNTATTMTATSKTLMPSLSMILCAAFGRCSRALLAPSFRAALATRTLEGPIGGLEAGHKVGQMLDFVNNDALGRSRRGAAA